jgi:hypothetical protein
MLVHQLNLSRQRTEELEVQIGINNSEFTRLQTHAAILEEQLQVCVNELLIYYISHHYRRAFCKNLRMSKGAMEWHLDNTVILESSFKPFRIGNR